MSARGVGRRTLRHVVALSVAATIGGCSYGPEEDHSSFRTAALLSDGRVALSYNWLTYRPPKGFSTFPDGGTPRYVKDFGVLAVYDIATGTVRVLEREENTRFTSGGEGFHVGQANGSLFLVSRSPQTRDLSRTVDETFLLDADNGAKSVVNYRTALPSSDRGWVMYLASPVGHMVFVTPLPRELSESEVGQIWVRSPSDSYQLAASTRHFIAIENGEMIYWVATTREFKAVDMATLATRTLTGYRERGFVEDTVQLRIEDGVVQHGRKVAGEWTYTSLPINVEALRSQPVWKR